VDQGDYLGRREQALAEMMGQMTKDDIDRISAAIAVPSVRACRG